MKQKPGRDADGRLLPDDVAIASFFNWAVMAEAARPPLTPVDLKLTGLGAEAWLCTAAMIGGTNEQGMRLLPCTLIPRASTLGSLSSGEQDAEVCFHVF